MIDIKIDRVKTVRVDRNNKRMLLRLTKLLGQRVNARVTHRREPDESLKKWD